MDTNPQKSGGPLKRWHTKQPLSAKHLNEPIDLLNKVFAPNGAQQTAGTGNVFIRSLYVHSVWDDVILCFYDASDTSGQVVVAKPYLLRRTPFDFSRNSYAVTRKVGSNEITYTFTEPVEEDLTADPPVDAVPLVRTATDEDDLTEDQVIVPAYTFGDVIFVVSGIREGTGVYLNGVTAGEENKHRVEYLDLNVDGRAWAVKI